MPEADSASTPRTSPPPQLSYVTLAVDDLTRAVAFYQQALGLPLIRHSAELAFFDLGAVRLALWGGGRLAIDIGWRTDPRGSTPTAADAPPGHSLSLNVASAAAVAELLQRAASLGGRLVQPATTPAWGGRRGYLRDPDGHLWEIAWHPGYDFRCPAPV